MSDRYGDAGLTREPEHFDEPAHPYAAAHMVWDEYVGQAHHEAARNFVISCGLVVVLGISLLGNLYQASRTTIVPYIVETDASGKVRLVGSVLEQEWSLEESVIKHAVTDFIVQLRQVPSDKELLLASQLYVESRTSEGARLQLRDRPDAALKKFGVERRFVTVRTITKMAQEGAWRAEWREEVLGESGDRIGEERFLGEFVLKITPPELASDMENNPLGVFVTYLTIQKLK